MQPTLIFTGERVPKTDFWEILAPNNFLAQKLEAILDSL